MLTCRGCRYWGALNRNENTKACHYSMCHPYTRMAVLGRDAVMNSEPGERCDLYKRRKKNDGFKNQNDWVRGGLL